MFAVSGFRSLHAGPYPTWRPQSRRLGNSRKAAAGRRRGALLFQPMAQVRRRQEEEKTARRAFPVTSAKAGFMVTDALAEKHGCNSGSLIYVGTGLYIPSKYHHNHVWHCIALRAFWLCPLSSVEIDIAGSVGETSLTHGLQGGMLGIMTAPNSLGWPAQCRCSGNSHPIHRPAAARKMGQTMADTERFKATCAALVPLRRKHL